MMTESHHTSGNIDKILRQAEMHHHQLQIEAQFNRNMDLFKELAPEIYNEYICYQPEELRISYDKDGYLNLVNYKLNNKPVYGQDPRLFSNKQVEDYKSRPSMSSINFAPSTVMNEDHIHVRLINRLLEETKQYSQDVKPSVDKPVGIMLLTGCGMGYHIEKLIEDIDIHNLVIFDPHKDSFYASLHTVDWYPIIKYFHQAGRMLKFLVGVSSKDAMANIKLLTDKIGLHNIVFTHIFRHFSSKKEDEFINLYKKEFHLNASGTGFFDDEQVSLAHTVANLNSKIPMFRHESSDKNLPPLLVIGNGPSLDQNRHLIDKFGKDCIIFSCGTALGSLYKMGIKPDFHVEMERNINISEWIKTGTDTDFRKDINLLCLNTVAPAAIALFDHVCTAKKPNDIGQTIITKAMQGKGVSELQLCNPTVTNAALSFGISMGFKEIYLIGVDLGTKPDGKHHSQFSLYNDIEKKSNDEEKSAFNYSHGRYEIDGNFGGKVFSNPYLDATRIHMEILLRHVERTSNDVKCYNPNDGAHIDGAEAIKADSITINSSGLDKAGLIRKLRETHFVSPDQETITEDDIRERYLKGFYKVKNQLHLEEEIESPEALYSRLCEIYNTIRILSKENPAAAMLLRGSINGYFTILMKSCYYNSDPSKFRDAYSLCQTIYEQFLDEAYEFMQRNPLKLDNTYDIHVRKLIKQNLQN